MIYAATFRIVLMRSTIYCYDYSCLKVFREPLRRSARRSRLPHSGSCRWKGHYQYIGAHFPSTVFQRLLDQRIHSTTFIALTVLSKYITDIFIDPEHPFTRRLSYMTFKQASKRLKKHTALTKRSEKVSLHRTRTSLSISSSGFFRMWINKKCAKDSVLITTHLELHLFRDSGSL